VPDGQREFLQNIIEGGSGIATQYLNVSLPPLHADSPPLTSDFTTTNTQVTSAKAHKMRPKNSQFGKILKRRKITNTQGTQNENYTWQVLWYNQGISY
jgi:hypothetical protein